MIVGPLLARFGKGYIPKPGGDKIGRRRLDTHFEGFIALGAKFRYNREDLFYGVEADKLKGTYMLQFWLKAQQQFTMLLASLIYSNFVICLIEWEPKFLVLALI